MSMITIGSDNMVIIRHCRNCSNSHSLLAYVKVQKAANVTLLIGPQ